MQGAVAAGMKIVVVPSIVETTEDYTITTGADTNAAGVCQVLPSLLAFQPQVFGLPPFKDLVEGVIPLEPVIKLKGTVVKGFGRGSKELGIPTANVDADTLRQSMAEAVTGIYCGWASVGDSTEVHKMVMSIGWNPFYSNKEKTAEPWILHDFEKVKDRVAGARMMHKWHLWSCQIGNSSLHIYGSQTDAGPGVAPRAIL
eukprot:GHRR01036464.1.p1 GENE.GHRR01036464.1~~GHRR01036464.1.p1  ORF type:complete len:200 (+),score=51.86 GHRR01036464.1:1088-1687(+)